MCEAARILNIYIRCQQLLIKASQNVATQLAFTPSNSTISQPAVSLSVYTIAHLSSAYRSPPQHTCRQPIGLHHNTACRQPIRLHHNTA
ncbi:hypothetical protein PoB_005507200 [Plakobranchus ocellatus]|uniref:Uncharacterized protein n=1 Tax=Plakobranchus ocellatus TaxID=259542 RepID=A0AAV4CB18_9GAST|nr:hypothetical protein PoB_005507200 [Plakobranchus ocellatus]